MIIHTCEQGTDEWLKLRCGLPTASNFDKILTTSGKPSTQKTKYLYKVAGEYLTKKPEETYQNAAMVRGSEMEGEARELYEVVTGLKVEQVGFCTDDDVIYGASPDGLVDDGLIEIKCPNLATHVGYLLDNKMPTGYMMQVQGQMLVTGALWTDFMSYYPGMKPFIIRVDRDQELINKLEDELKEFNNQLKEIITKIGE